MPIKTLVNYLISVMPSLRIVNPLRLHSYPEGNCLFNVFATFLLGKHDANINMSENLWVYSNFELISNIDVYKRDELCRIYLRHSHVYSNYVSRQGGIIHPVNLTFVNYPNLVLICVIYFTKINSIFSVLSLKFYKIIVTL